MYIIFFFIFLFIYLFFFIVHVVRLGHTWTLMLIIHRKLLICFDIFLFARSQTAFDMANSQVGWGQLKTTCDQCPYLPFCSKALLADLTVLRVFRVVYFEVKPQRPQLFEAFIALAAMEALLLCVHLRRTIKITSPRQM